MNADDAWIELYNAGATSVALGGWQLAAINGTRTMTFTLPMTATIPARGFSIFFHQQTQLDLAGAGEVRLLYPNGNLVDAVRYPRLRYDQTYARSVDGGGHWTPDCIPSPDTPNCTRVATITSSFNLPFFQKHIADPSILGRLNVNVLATNVLLALILALAFGFFGNLLNDAVESHEERVQRWIAPVRAVTTRLQRAGTQIDALLGAWRPLFWLSFSLRLAVLLLLYGFVLAFLDPSFVMPDRDGWLLILALALSAGLVSLIDDIAQYVYLRLHDSESVIRIHGGNLVLVLLTTLFSRFSGLVPGLLVGSPAGIEDVQDPDFEIKSHLLGVGSLIAVSAGAWLLSPLFDADAWFKTLFLLIFAAGVQTLFFEMLPLKYLHGQGVFQFNRTLWLVLFIAAATVFLQTMLNPDGAFVAAFESPNMVLLSIVVIAFCIFSTAVWFYLQRLEKLQAAEVAGVSEGK
jgi:type III secretory pathway component EscS